ncbi:MAG: hypothetical protein H6974_14325 [Gammaproteobacteria bacterium]|nr:hypothetical protein [Gammaproteobacteria bacterium]
MTLTLPDELYRLARSKAAAADTSLSRVVRDYPSRRTVEDADRAKRIARLDKLFAESDARDRDQIGSAGPFSRSELYDERLERFR